MDERYEIQARTVERRAGTILRDETRLAVAESAGAALELAREFAAEGFQAWVYAVCAQPGRTAPVYRSVTHLHPATRGPAA